MHRADRHKQMPSQALYRASCFMFEERLQDGFRVFLPNQSRSQCLTWTALSNTIFVKDVFKNLVRSSCPCELSFNSDGHQSCHVHFYCHSGLDWKSTHAESFALIQRMNMNVLWFVVSWNCFQTSRCSFTIGGSEKGIDKCFATSFISALTIWLLIDELLICMQS